MPDRERPVFESAAKAGDVRRLQGPVMGSWVQ